MIEAVKLFAGKALSFLAGWKGYATVAAACLVIGASGTWRVMSWRAQAHETQAAVAAVKQQWALDKKSYDMGVEFGKTQASIRVVTRTLTQKVPVYVSQKADDNCVLPVGFMRMYVGAIHEGNIPTSVVSDDTPSGFACSRLVANDIAIIGQYYEVAAQLMALQKYEAERIAQEEKAAK